MEGTVFAITTLNENPVLVDGTSYTKDQVVLTLTADKSGSAATAKDALPFGHYRVDETTAPSGYLNSGKISVEFDITEQGKIVELTAKDNSISVMPALPPNGTNIPQIPTGVSLRKTASGSAPPNRMIPKALSFTILTLWRNSVVIPTKAWIF